MGSDRERSTVRKHFNWMSRCDECDSTLLFYKLTKRVEESNRAYRRSGEGRLKVGTVGRDLQVVSYPSYF